MDQIRWQAITDDGTVLNPDRVAYLDLFGKYQSRLVEFRLIDGGTGVCGHCRNPVIAPHILVRMRLDPSKRIIFRKRPPLPDMTSTRKADVVWLIGWQQTLHHYTDLAGNPAVVYSIMIFNERTREVHALDRFVSDVAAGTHTPELYVKELEGGVRGVFDPLTGIRPVTGAIEAEEEKDKDIAGVKVDVEEGSYK